jgi:hypothetical protein
MDRYYLLVDAKGLPCQWLIVKGIVRRDNHGTWLAGSIVERGPDFQRGERHSVKEQSDGWSYALGLPGTSWTELTAYTRG